MNGAFDAWSNTPSFQVVFEVEASCFFPFSLGLARRKIRLMKCNAKCFHLKELICKGTLWHLFICLKPRTPYKPPTPHLQSVYVYTVHTGKGGGGDLNQREGERGNSSPSWVKNTNVTDCLQSIKSDKHLPQIPLTGRFFKMTNFCYDVRIVN
jgi:hypothetical protein